MARLIDADALLELWGLKECVKYGNKSMEERERSYDTMMMYEIVEMLNDAPTVQQWIPVEERLPEKEGKYLCTCIYDKSFGPYIDLIEYYKDKWFTDDYDGCSLELDQNEVIAWMPLPIPYNVAK